MPMTESENRPARGPLFQSLAVVAISAALVWTILIGWRIWTTPVRYQSIQWRADAQGQTVRELGDTFRTFRDVSLLGAAPLIVPVALAMCALAAAVRGSRAVLTICVLLFLLFAFVSGFSIGGGYFMPGVLLLLASGVSLVVRGGRHAGLDRD